MSASIWTGKEYSGTGLNTNTAEHGHFNFKYKLDYVGNIEDGFCSSVSFQAKELYIGTCFKSRTYSFTVKMVTFVSNISILRVPLVTRILTPLTCSSQHIVYLAP